MKRERKEYFGNTVILFQSEIYDGELCDTEIFIAGRSIMTIAGNELENFLQDLNKLNSYAI